MKTAMIMLATLGGIGIGIAEASAGDAQNLSCITETSADGKTVRDCEPKPAPEIYVLEQVVIEPDSPTPPPAFGHDGGARKSDGARRDERGGEPGGTVH